MIDLHAHSTFSDGSCTPRELVELAKAGGLSAVALTDHDSTAGLGLFMQACSAMGVEGVPGVEISAEPLHGTLHLLGYYFDIENGPLQAALLEIREGRRLRNERMLAKLNELGCRLNWMEVAAFAGEEVVGRPHFAQAMLARGYVSDKAEVFDKYLGKGKAAYVERFRLSPADAISLILDAGGIAVLAHPFSLNMSKTALKDFVGTMVDKGLGGIEIYYSEHSPEQINMYLEIAEEYGLLVTGGSDFHGDANPKVKLGRGFGNLYVADELLEKLKARLG